MAEQVLLLENIATSILVSDDQLPSLHKILTEAASILQMDAPDLYVRQVGILIPSSGTSSSVEPEPKGIMPYPFVCAHKQLFHVADVLR